MTSLLSGSNSKPESPRESYRRFVLFPIRDTIAWEYYQAGLASHWTAADVDIADDIADLRTLTEAERHVALTVLAFFAISDGIVQEVICNSFMAETTIPEERIFYGWQIFNEGIHATVYSLLVDAYAPDPVEKDKLFNAVDEIDIIKKKADWSLKWLENADYPYPLRLVANACTEGIFFAPSFNFIYWFTSRNLLPGLTMSNKKIAPDERLHTEFAAHAFNKRVDERQRQKWHKDVVAMIEEAVDIESEFVRFCLPEVIRVPGLNLDPEDCIEYVKFVADWLLVLLNYPPHYGAENRCSWMESISMESKTNFHELKVAHYSNTIVRRSDEAAKFSMDAVI